MADNAKKVPQRPKGLKKEAVTVPVELGEKDKAQMMDDIVDIQIQQEEKSEELAELKATHKEAEKVVSEEINLMDEKINAKFVACRKGFTEEDMSLFPRKNFDLDPPSMEYVDEDGEVKHTVILRPDQHQTAIHEWCIGEPKPPSKKSDNKPNDESSKEESNN